MSLDDLKQIIYQESRYNFIFTDFNFCLTSNSTSTKNNVTIREDIHTANLFLSPYHLCEVGIGLNQNEKSWGLELILKKAELPPIHSYAEKNNMYRNDSEIKNEFYQLLNNFDNNKFLKEPTLPEVLEKLENYFKSLLLKNDITYVPNIFTDKLMIAISQHFDLNDSSVKSMMFGEKERGILYKKLTNKITDNISKSTIKKI